MSAPISSHFRDKEYCESSINNAVQICADQAKQRANVLQRQRRQPLSLIVEEILPSILHVIALAKGLLSAQPRTTFKIINH